MADDESNIGRTFEFGAWGGMNDGADTFCDAWIGFSGAELLDRAKGAGK
jgi:hypothetical protein